MSGHRDSVSWVSPGWTSIAQLAVNAVFMIAAPFLPSRQLVCAVELMMLGLSGQLLTAYLEGRRAGVVFATLLGVSATKGALRANNSRARFESFRAGHHVIIFRFRR